MKTRIILAFWLISLVAASCTNPQSSPRPRAYFRIALPQRAYQQFDSAYPYSFEYPTYARLEPNRSNDAEPYWVNLTFPKFNATVHLTYKHVDSDINGFLEDAYTLAYKHSVKADAIGEQLYQNDSLHVYGVYYHIEGNAASPIQFFLTDSVAHFLRGALYFNCHPNKDSLAPVVDFLDKDIAHLMESLQWK